MDPGKRHSPTSLTATLRVMVGLWGVLLISHATGTPPRSVGSERDNVTAPHPVPVGTAAFGSLTSLRPLPPTSARAEPDAPIIPLEPGPNHLAAPPVKWAALTAMVEDGGPAPHQAAPPDSPLPAPQQSRVRLPLAGSEFPDEVRVEVRGGLVTLIARDVPLADVLATLVRQQSLSLITADRIEARLSVTMVDVPFDDVLNAILSVAGYTWVRQGTILIVTPMSGERRLAPQTQGRQLRVFTLDYAAAADVDTVVKGLLSPLGQSYITKSDQADYRKTQELLVVEDLPAYLERIEQYVAQVDVPPRQVLIEAHVLQVELSDDRECGIDLSYLKIGDPAVELGTRGLSTIGTPQAFVFDLAASNIAAIVKALETTTDAKTLAAPKVFVLNGQEAHIQIGAQLGYRVTTTTQTSTLESVDFLDTGVVLRVRPQITRDNNVMMYVKPEVSSGQVNPLTELPEEETTQVETSVMLADGHGMVIGGLIQETDIESQNKVPILGDLWLIGRLFQKRETNRKRTEIIIALVPYVVPYPCNQYARESQQFERATTPLLQDALQEHPRPWEPQLPSCDTKPWCRPCGPHGQPAAPADCP